VATFPTISQVGGPVRWQNSGGGITNHEVFIFALQFASQDNVGALMYDVTVYSPPFTESTYNITLNAVDGSANPIDRVITGNFESTPV
jgi:hypothetical protein